MRTVLLVAVACLCAQPAQAAYAILAPANRTAMARTPAGEEVLVRARAALTRPPAAIARLHTEGTLPGQGIRDRSVVAKADHAVALDLAIAWAMTRDRRYLDQAARYLEDWADTYRISLNPIDETGFDQLILASDLTDGDLSPALAAKLSAFWHRMASGYLHAMGGMPANPHSNWQSHRIKLATLAAYRSGDVALVQRARQAFRRQIALNLRADGSTFDFEERDALHYVTYALDPLLVAAIAARAHGEDWYGYRAPSGASLHRTLDWLAVYARGERVHIDFARSRVPFDRERAAAGQKEFAPHRWRPSQALNSFSFAAVLDPRFCGLRDQLAQQARRPIPFWSRLA